MIERLGELGKSKLYWLGLVILALSMEGMALLYQYVGDYEPCVLCIHVRLWLLLLIVVALLALVWRDKSLANAASHLVVGGVMVAMTERSYQLLATERGWIFGSCNMDAGLPEWFALDQWFPAVLGVKEACGYTPELLFGITMAEALLAFSIVMVLQALLFAWLSLRA